VAFLSLFLNIIDKTGTGGDMSTSLWTEN